MNAKDHLRTTIEEFNAEPQNQIKITPDNHTPGRWTFDADLHIHGRVPMKTYGCNAEPQLAIAHRYADAALISSAPEMLAAIEEILRIASSNRDILKGAPNYSGLFRIEELAAAIITKAKGE